MAIQETLIHQQRSTVPREPVLQLTVEQYHEMLNAGILTDDDPVELLDGLLVTKMTKHPPHRIATTLISDALRRILPAGWYVEVQNPITTDDSEPEPDVAVVRGSTRDYPNRHPSPSDVALVVEVADDSLRRDKTTKRRLYARAGIPIYWIANLIDNAIEVYSQPTGKGMNVDYQEREDYTVDDNVPVVIAGGEVGRIAVRHLLA